MVIEILFLTASLVLTVLFFFYGFNHYFLLIAAQQYISPGLLPGLLQRSFRVAIHLPVYNEKYVIRRLVAACACMAEEYGIDKVKIVIIDDSDDETADIVDEVVAGYREKLFNIGVLRRGSRQGFKAGALQAALDQTEEEFIAIFDADFIPPADFLIRSLPFFIQDENLGIIQSRWANINRDYNFLTRAIAVGIDVHFLIEQAGRYAVGCYQNFNGSAGVIRTKALVKAGGWQADTLAEDLDVSYRIQFKGYRILYLKDLQSPGEVPLTVPSYKKQQGRWACGSLRTAKKLLPTLMSLRNLGFTKRLEGFIHLTNYMVHPLMFTSFLLACLATPLGVDSFRFVETISRFQEGFNSGIWRPSAAFAPQYVLWALIALLITLCTVAAWIPPWVAMSGQALPASRKLANFVILFLLGCGVSLSNTIEAGKALLSDRKWPFRRTPKYAIQRHEEGWRNKRYQVSLDFVCILEIILVCLGGSSIGYAVWHSNFGVLLILVPFTSAYAFVSVLTILQSQRGQGA